MNFIELICGVMMSKKSFTLLQDYHENKDSKKCFTVLPKIMEIPYGGVIKTRVEGVPSAKVDLFVNDQTNLQESIPLDKVDIIYIDEAQFLTRSHIDQLLVISETKQVKLFGIQETYKGEMWDTMKYIFEKETIVKKELHREGLFDKNLATKNMKFVNGVSVKEGEKLIEAETDEVIYYPVCDQCYNSEKVLGN